MNGSMMRDAFQHHTWATLRLIEADSGAWAKLLANEADPNRVVTEVHEDDGFERDAPIGVRLAQALHHGVDHRSQICTALTTLDIKPPATDVWAYALETGRSAKREPNR